MYAVYILASRRNGTLYVGVTNDLPRRVAEHRDDAVAGFTHPTQHQHLVHYEMFDDVTAAIAREKQLKRWRRRWKLELIESGNPDWQDPYEQLSP